MVYSGEVVSSPYVNKGGQWYPPYESPSRGEVLGKPIHCFIHWIEIHRVDGAIQPLNNWDLLLHLFKRDDV